MVLKLTTTECPFVASRKSIVIGSIREKSQKVLPSLGGSSSATARRGYGSPGNVANVIGANVVKRLISVIVHRRAAAERRIHDNLQRGGGFGFFGDVIPLCGEFEAIGWCLRKCWNRRSDETDKQPHDHTLTRPIKSSIGICMIRAHAIFRGAERTLCMNRFQ